MASYDFSHLLDRPEGMSDEEYMSNVKEYAKQTKGTSGSTKSRRKKEAASDAATIAASQPKVVRPGASSAADLINTIKGAAGPGVSLKEGKRLKESDRNPFENNPASQVVAVPGVGIHLGPKAPHHEMSHFDNMDATLGKVEDAASIHEAYLRSKGMDTSHMDTLWGSLANAHGARDKALQSHIAGTTGIEGGVGRSRRAAGNGASIEVRGGSVQYMNNAAGHIKDAVSKLAEITADRGPHSSTAQGIGSAADEAEAHARTYQRSIERATETEAKPSIFDTAQTNRSSSRTFTTKRPDVHSPEEQATANQATHERFLSAMSTPGHVVGAPRELTATRGEMRDYNAPTQAGKAELEGMQRILNKKPEKKAGIVPPTVLDDKTGEVIKPARLYKGTGLEQPRTLPADTPKSEIARLKQANVDRRSRQLEFLGGLAAKEAKKPAKEANEFGVKTNLVKNKAGKVLRKTYQ